MMHRFFNLLVFLLVAGALGAAEEKPALGVKVGEGVGHDWVLPNGQLVNLQIIANQFHLLFLDADRWVIEPTVEKVIVRGEEARNKTNELNLVLRKGSGASLMHVRTFFAPFDYWLRLLVPSEEAADEWVSLTRVRFSPGVDK